MPKLNRGRRRSCYRRCRPRAQKRHASGCSYTKRNVWQRSSQQPWLANTLALAALAALVALAALAPGRLNRG